MMQYIPGNIHESLQKEHFFLVNLNFSWINCKDKRLSDMNDSLDWEETDTIELTEGDIIAVRFFKSSQTSSAYIYLERVYYNDGDTHEYKIESTTSLALIERNLNPNKFGNKSWLFTDITEIFIRDKKIEDILC